MSPTPAVTRALAFVEANGVVLVSAKGSAPRLIEAVAGEPIHGNWWSHPRANALYNVVAQVTDSEDILVCRLINGKLTLVHRRLWPALVHLASRFSPRQITRVREQHTATGRHTTSEVAFPEWVPPEVAQQARNVDDAEAVAIFGRWLDARS